MAMTHEARWDHHTQWSMCPHCGALHDGAARMDGDGQGPTEGAFGLCWECGDWTVYTADLQRRKPTDEESILLATEPELIHAMKTYWQYRLMFPKWPPGRSG